jgi:pyruvate formate lyase activating enzyme
MRPAMLFEKSGQNKVKCNLCPHHCILRDGDMGVCRVRKNIKGILYSLNYDKVAATHSDPIEKKPLYHFLPSSTSYSIAAMGCNFQCSFCQNHSISMVQTESHIYGEDISPEQLVKDALASQSQSISYTYTEPTIYFELMLETAKLAKEEGIKNVMVTNGYMSAEAFELMNPFLDAANIDLKAFSETFYMKYPKARLQPVLDTIKRMKENDVWVEVTTLLIEGLNSDPQEIKELISFLLEVDENIPWHVSRFFPQYKLQDRSITPVETIYQCLETAKEMGLNYLYGGNIPSESWANTYCQECQTLLIERSGYFTSIPGITNGKCSNCNLQIPGIWH